LTRQPEELEFRPEDPSTVLLQMDRLAAAHRGWLNLQPGIREEDAPPPTSVLGLIFSSPSHEVPVCTWVPGHVGRHGLEPDEVGVQHATGTRVVARLAGLGLPLPEGWRWTQDHPRRGLVVRTPLGASHTEQLDWLLRVGTALATVPLTGDWRALVYDGR
jgi:hypothetical protein